MVEKASEKNGEMSRCKSTMRTVTVVLQGLHFLFMDTGPSYTVLNPGYATGPLDAKNIYYSVCDTTHGSGKSRFARDDEVI
ncbi:hypothetical protein LSCM4_06998 [Leishmania orientalis]|uniref:Uncharacterized protein n=1 Tax=Leishmania orientalis TaxID=2249476 RepID=A0A836GXF5_9TRYP|nr:hypothetical protein LSCM4_06998 [Leishmania orientalis]